jgi:D-alanyl-D-alanine dipeptidase
MLKIKTYLLILFVVFSGILSAQHDTSIVLLKDIDPTIAQDVRYATTNNFTGQVLYPTDKVYLRKIAADSLAKANKYLKEKYGLHIKIFDGYRPLSVQKKMWKVYPNADFVADPKKGSRHNRGAAVDITLIDSTGKELDFGSAYDEFSKRSRRNYKGLSKEQTKNRAMLDEAMTKYGFIPLSSEWWHFDFNHWRRYSILDVEIK